MRSVWGRASPSLSTAPQLRQLQPPGTSGSQSGVSVPWQRGQALSSSTSSFSRLRNCHFRARRCFRKGAAAGMNDVFRVATVADNDHLAVGKVAEGQQASTPPTPNLSKRPSAVIHRANAESFRPPNTYKQKPACRPPYAGGRGSPCQRAPTVVCGGGRRRHRPPPLEEKPPGKLENPGGELPYTPDTLQNAVGR